MRVIIYGLGKEALFVSSVVKREHVVIGFTDSYARIKNYAGYPYYPNSRLKDIEYDYIILALNNRKISEDIKEELVSGGGVTECKIIDFFSLYALQKVDKVMTDKEKNADGIILGISNSAFGINPDYLDGEWYNLANGSEDLYYYYKVLEKCERIYSNKIQHLKYVILDLYDYTVFNRDVSRSKAILTYWEHGGYMEDLHNYALNENYAGSAGEEMKAAGFYSSIHSAADSELREMLFDEKLVRKSMGLMYTQKHQRNLGYNDYPLQIQLEKTIPPEPLLPYDMHFMGERRYADTIEENISVLNEIIKLLKKINNKIKIVMILMPRYGVMEKWHQCLLAEYKTEFHNIIKSFRFEEDENCYLWNFKDAKEFSWNSHFYSDVGHFNYIGAIAFTSMLNEQLRHLDD